MRSIEFYQDKIAQSMTLAELEKHLHSSLKQLKQDHEQALNKRNRLMDQLKELDTVIGNFTTTEKQITTKAQARTQEILATMATGITKKRGRPRKAN